MDHLSDHDLERYHLGMIRDAAELAAFEERVCGLRGAGGAERHLRGLDPGGGHPRKFRP
jgi:hypothetical protein